MKTKVGTTTMVAPKPRQERLHTQLDLKDNCLQSSQFQTQEGQIFETAQVSTDLPIWKQPLGMKKTQRLKEINPKGQGSRVALPK